MELHRIEAETVINTEITNHEIKQELMEFIHQHNLKGRDVIRKMAEMIQRFYMKLNEIEERKDW